jgi:signal transduction histidine kinase
MAERAENDRETVPREPRRGIGLSGRVLILTILFVLVVEILIYLPSIVNFRDTWLGERLSQARAAALILEKAPPDSLPPPLVNELLAGMETTMIALRIENARRLLAISDMPPTVSFEIDLRKRDPLMALATTLDILLFGADRAIRVVGPPPQGGDFVEIVINEKPLRAAMFTFTRTMLVVSLILSAMIALILFAALNGLIVQPVKRLAENVARFRAHPEDIRSIHDIAPDRRDELSTLERNVAQMQLSLQHELRQREHLANLGLAVAKINHDLRNMLAAAQLMADRLGAVPEPNVQRFVPRLLDALDRAIAFCQSTLAYGRAQERPPVLAPVEITGLAREIGDQLNLHETSRPALKIAIASPLIVAADGEHLARVITNLVRNAIAALDGADGAIADPAIVITARRSEAGIEIDIRDNGPGIPPKIREQLFRAFSGSSRPGGTGLGLAIAQELMRGMGGTLTLAEEPGQRGTVFRLFLPAAGASG